MNDQECISSIFLNSLAEVVPVRFQALVRAFGSAEAALASGPERWAELSEFDEPAIRAIRSSYGGLVKTAEEEWGRLKREGVRVYLFHSGAYPPLLREIKNPPPLLYVWGEDITAERPAIAIVGSRKCTFYGEQAARQLTHSLSVRGITTISGMARGIDSRVHEETLRAGGKTWAVIGSGLARIYPPENRALAKKIVQSGALISEFPMAMNPYPGNFPRRNRIIAGLSYGTVVVEGTLKSGALITARLAAEEGRDVFALPGPIFSAMSQGPNFLIQSGAKLVSRVDEIIDELPEKFKRTRGAGNDEEDHLRSPKAFEKFKNILDYLGDAPVPKEELSVKFHIGPNELAALLLEMEIKGLVRSQPGGYLVKVAKEKLFEH